jgi:sirohydrochlorin ferrochelatase
MRSLILVAHGSRRRTSNEEVRRLTGTLGEKAGSRFDLVSCAFLELAEPSIPEGIEQAVQQGASEIVILPYFLSAGRHVAEDIPAAVATKQQEYPQVTIHVAPYLGLAAGIPDLLLASVSQAV